MTIPCQLKDRTRTLVRCESGTSLVEFAIVLPFLALLLIGLIDFGRYTYDAVLAANAARPRFNTVLKTCRKLRTSSA